MLSLIKIRVKYIIRNPCLLFWTYLFLPIIITIVAIVTISKKKKLDMKTFESVILPGDPKKFFEQNKKLMEIKHCFMKFKLFPDPKEKNKETNFYLNNKELNIILSYLNESYFPFIRLFYHVINLNRIETKKINSTVSKPLAVNNNDDTAPEKFIIEEQVKRPIEKEKKIDEMIEKELENKFDSNDLKNRQVELENKARNDYINEVKKNYTSCLGYSIDLLNQIFFFSHI